MFNEYDVECIEGLGEVYTIHHSEEQDIDIFTLEDSIKDEYIHMGYGSTMSDEELVNLIVSLF